MALKRRKGLKDMFRYDPETGNLIRTKTTSPNAVKDNVVGYDDGRGYLRVNIDKKCHYVHRIIWELCNGEIPPGLMIDHINGNGLDNRLENLRLVDASHNGRNKKNYLNTESGIFGVQRTPENKWKARIKVRGKQIHIGHYDNLQEAIEARKEAEKKYKFHPNHGRT